MNAVYTPKVAAQLLNYSDKARLPLVLQTEAAECGLACIAMIASYYGYKTDMVSLRNRFTFSTHGTNLKQLQDMAIRLNMSCRALKLELSEIDQIRTPCILHWDMCHFVVLKAVKAKSIVIHDPSFGIREFSKKQFSDHFTGVALELIPNEQFEPKTVSQKLHLSQFWHHMVGLPKALAHVFGLSIVLQLIAIASPLYVQTVVDDVVIRSDQNLLVILAMAFGALMLVRVLTNALRQYLILHLSTKLNIQMASGLFFHLIRLPLDFFEKRHMGDIVSRFRSLENIRNLITTKLVTASVDSLMATITLIAMAIYSVKLTIMVCGFVGLYAMLRLALYSTYRRVSEETIVADAKEESCFMESIRAIQTIKIFQKETDRQNTWLNSYAESLNGHIRVSRWDISYALINNLLFGLENILIVYLASELVMGNLISVGMLYAFISFKQQFVERMEGLVAALIDYKMVGLHLQRLADIVFTKIDPNIKSLISGTQDERDIKGEIEVNNLNFRYGESEDFVIENISFKVAADECVAIVAPSGGGKTTLLKCMMGLLSPESGKVFVDGCDVAKLAKYRQSIAGVMQDDQLLSGTIADNIACFNVARDMNEIIRCASAAAIHNDIMAMPMQYNTLVGDMGSSLSGGQRQRIILARALFKQPKILFLDEATSHLDIQNESIVNDNIAHLKITRIIVAHRPETIARADRVIYLKNDTKTLQA